jgi:chemotaxis response regulator CheB
MSLPRLLFLLRWTGLPGGATVDAARRGGREAVQMALNLQPDVITLDVEMPRAPFTLR